MQRVLVAALLVGLVASLDAPLAPTFDKATSYRFLYYSYAAYNVPAVGTWNCAYCTNYTKGFVHTQNCQDTKTGGFSYVGYHPSYSEIVVSFRGSSNLQNWIADLYAIKTPPGEAFPGIPNAQVHTGFWSYYQSMKSCIMTEVKNLKSKYPAYTLAITGHSLGAAGSALAAMDMTVNMGYSGIRVLNYGEPRVGNPAYSDASRQRLPGLQRMVNYADCVPKLPPQGLGYKHEPYEIFETPSGGNNYKVCDSSGEDPSCSNSLGQNCDDHTIYMGVPCCNHP